MSKRYRNRYKPRTQSTQPIDNYSTDEEDLPYTHDPLASRTPTGSWINDQSTTASSNDDSEDEEVSLTPNTWANFATNVIQGRLGRPFVLFSAVTFIWLGINLWILIQDNSHEFLQSADGWIMYGNKIGISSIFYLIASIMLGINWWLRVLQRKKKNRST